MRQHSISQRKRVALLLVMLVTLAGMLGGLMFMAYMKTPQAKSQRNPAAPIVGTWIGDMGNVINIRSDGTARVRHSPKYKEEIGYFEWTLDSGKFAIYQYKKKYNLGWFVRRAMMDDRPTDRFDVIEMKPTAFKLSTDTGEVVTFSSTHDIDLETAP